MKDPICERCADLECNERERDLKKGENYDCYKSIKRGGGER